MRQSAQRDAQRRVVSRLAPWVLLGVVAILGAKTATPVDPEKPRAAGQNPGPFGEMIRRLFNGPPPQQPRNNRFEPALSPADSRPHLDVSLNSDSSANRDLEKLQPYIDRQRWNEVATGLQFLIERPVDTFAPGSSGNWVSLRQRSEELLRGLPPDGLRTYRSIYNQAAADRLAEALAAEDMNGVVDVAKRYSLTDAGPQAIRELARGAFDRSEYAGAVRWYERLDPAHSSDAITGQDLRQYAYALRQVGREREGEKLLTDDALREWWQGLPKVAPPVIARKTNWPMPAGAPEGTAAADGGEPLLAARWLQSTAATHTVAEQARQLTADLRDAGRACLPAMQSVLVDGCVAVRTLHGILVARLDNGKVLWEEPAAADSPEQLLLSQGDEPLEGRRRTGFGRFRAYSGGEDYDQHTLTSLLYRDGVYGSLTSDGEQLFAVTRHAVLARYNSGYGMWGQVELPADRLGRDWKTNAIAAYDLKSGGLRWRAGGPRLGELLDPPLAGTFFFGPPTPVDDELYAIGERDNEISLYVLDRLTGRLLSQQPLANSMAGIDSDMARRLWACPPSVADGTVICPTTVGWLIAVDRLDGRLLWAYRAAGAGVDFEQRRFGGLSVLPIHPLNVSWAGAPPVIAGSRVLWTPQEQPDALQSKPALLVCLDLLTGRELWRRDKEPDDLYLAGVSGETVLVVGKSRIQGLSLQTGKARWRSVTLPLAGPPSGRGIAIGEQYHLPLANGELWVLDIATGKVTSKLTTPTGAGALGNLAVHQGRLVSADPFQVQCFDRRSVIEAEIADRRRADPRDVWASVWEAEIKQLRGEHDLAVEILRKTATREEIDPELAQHRGELLRTSLWTLVKQDLNGRDREFEELQGVTPPEFQAELLRLAVDRAAARGNLAEAWKQLWGLAQIPDKSEFVTDQQRQVRLDRWIGGRLADLHAAADASLKTDMDDTLREAVRGALQSTEPQRAAALRHIVWFHPSGDRLTRALAERAAANQDRSTAELCWRRLLASADFDSRLTAGLKLAESRAAGGFPGDANAAIATLAASAKSVGEQRLADAEIASFRQRLELRGGDGLQAAVPNWSAYDLELVARNPTNDRGGNRHEVVTYPADSPFFRQHQLELVDPQRLRMTGLHGEQYWDLPLRAPDRQTFDENLGVRTDGLHAYAVYRGVVHALSVADRKLLWTHPVEIRSAGGEFVRNAYAATDTVLHPLGQFADYVGIARFHPATGMIASADPECVIVYGQREITALDPLTGDVLWRRQGVGQHRMAYGDGKFVYVLPEDANEPLLLRGADGKPLDNQTLSRHVRRTIAVQSGRLIIVDVETTRGVVGTRLSRGVIRAVDALTGDEAWSQPLDGKSLAGWVRSDALALLEPNGELRLLDTHSGRTHRLGAAPRDLLGGDKPVQIVSDADSLFLLIDQRVSQQISYMSLPAARINGVVLAFDLGDGGLLWQRPLGDTHLLLPSFERSPVLVFLNQEGVDSPNYFLTRLKVLDKRTGRELLQTDDLITQYQLQQFEVDLANSRLRIQTVGTRLDIRPKLAAAVEAEPAPPTEVRPTEPPTPRPPSP